MTESTIMLSPSFTSLADELRLRTMLHNPVELSPLWQCIPAVVLSCMEVQP